MPTAVDVEARQLVGMAGMSGYMPQAKAYELLGGDALPQLIPLEAILEPELGANTTYFVVSEALAILHAFKVGNRIAPIDVTTDDTLPSPLKYLLCEGLHRLYLSRAIGFTHIWANVLPECPAERL